MNNYRSIYDSFYLSYKNKQGILSVQDDLDEIIIYLIYDKDRLNELIPTEISGIRIQAIEIHEGIEAYEIALEELQYYPNEIAEKFIKEDLVCLKNLLKNSYN